ncbi:MAG: dihydroneopterin aldolase [Nitrospirae bacterium]|nr:MAG: dihydroneopterin aldolase [Nitrospirota bacterium]
MNGEADCIHIRDLLLRTIIGTNDDERRDRQDVIVNLTLHTDVRRAGESDDMKDTVNYRSVAKLVIELVEGTQYYLVEALATEIARAVLAEFPVSRIRVSVEKPGALRFARSVGIEIARTRKDFGL